MSKIWITSPLAVFLKHGQRYSSKIPNSIPACVSWPEHPKGTKDEVKRSEGAPDFMCVDNFAPEMSNAMIFDTENV